jgi:hypothetical protein
MASKRKKGASTAANAPAVAIRGVSISAVARIGTRFQSNPEELQQSQHYSTKRRREAETHRDLYVKWDVQKVDLQLAKGGTLEWHLPNLSQMIKWHFENNALFRDALAAVVKSNPNKPVHLLPYSDEYTPGNVLHPEVRKKTCAWYVSVMEFGEALSSVALWIPAAALLSSKMKRIAGKSSYAHRVFLEAALSDPLGICNSGILLSIDGVETLVTAVLEDPIGDELDLKSSLDVMGSSGVKPCFKCTNVCMRDHDGSKLPGHVDITCTDTSEFSSMTDADLYEASDAVHAAAPSKRKKEATHWGVNYSPNGVLQSALVRSRMRPTRSRFDRMHVCESNGIAAMEIDLLIASLAADKKFSNKEVADFCNAGWFTQRHANKTAEKVRISIRDNQFKGMASDVLTAMPILYNFVCTCLQDWDKDKVESFKALYAVVAQLQRIKVSGDCSKDATGKLARLIALHGRLFKKAYGTTAVKPKHHYAFHLPQQFYLDGVYVDCFAMERMHALMKAESELVDDTSAPKSEFWVLSKANRVLIEEAKTLNVQPHGQAITVNGEPAVSVTCFASWRGSYAKGHVILIDDIPHMVDLCVKFRDRWGLVVQKLRKHKDVHAFVSEWRRQPGNSTLHVVKELWICFGRFFLLGYLSPYKRACIRLPPLNLLFMANTKPRTLFSDLQR